MSRYIDVNILIKKYIDTDIKKFSNSDVKIVLENLKQNILKAPSIDIVFCKECKHRYSGKLGKMCIGRDNDDFCSSGKGRERKETVDYKSVVLTCDDEGNWSMHGERKEGE